MKYFGFKNENIACGLPLPRESVFLSPPLPSGCQIAQTKRSLPSAKQGVFCDLAALKAFCFVKNDTFNVKKHKKALDELGIL